MQTMTPAQKAAATRKARAVATERRERRAGQAFIAAHATDLPYAIGLRLHDGGPKRRKAEVTSSGMLWIMDNAADLTRAVGRMALTG